MDPDTYGSAPLLGLNGVVFKSHASASERAIRNGIRLATEAVQHHINDLITQKISEAEQRLTNAARVSATLAA
jgi:glycerol-3-phosphate acyltransferase PlsX